MGGDGKSTLGLRREITEIEQKLLDSLFRIILNDLKEAWQAVAPIEFTIHTVETEPQFLRVLAPTEAVVAVGIEIRIGDNVGMMNIAVPSIIAKMMRQKFDQQWSMRRTQSTEAEQAAMLARIRPSQLGLDVRLRGPQTTGARFAPSGGRRRTELRLSRGPPAGRPAQRQAAISAAGSSRPAGKRAFLVETGPACARPADKD